ncbi:plastocyanin/azurin family copper-binding protein [Planococcus kocurii]|uniref:plastocyanin/azurin family copper-binding protein n=1 Tax=Planococcus kocurii TaxID=1374 RepID=UPI003CFD0AD2
MINKKFGFILAASILSLAACGEEQTSGNEKAEPAVEEQGSTAEETTAEEVEEEPAEEVVEEEPAEETTEAEPVEESSPEAKSGTASDLLSNGDKTSFVFNEAGEFSIFCEPHPVMQMTVIVEEGAEAMDKIEVDIADYAFGEETITVAPGTTIEWTNQDQVQHNVAFK